MKKLLFFILSVFALSSATAQIIPQPKSESYGEGSFTITNKSCLVYNSAARESALYLLNYLPFKQILSSTKVMAGDIELSINRYLDEEGYRLIVDKENIRIIGGSNAGVFNGIQTLLQLLPPQIYSGNVKLPISVPYCTIEDSPKFAYRGFMLDVARTWISTDKVKRYIDLMSYLKLNKLHFHLTDDEGWRIEIKSHPELAQIGGFRGGDSPVFPRYGKFDEKWGGYYTQQELKDIVAYAAQRNIEIIPEIDMPGHMRACKKAMGTLLTDSAFDQRVYLSAQNYTDNVIDVTKPYAITFIDHVITEIVKMHEEAGHPLTIFNIGGDEVPKGSLTQEEHQAFIDGVLAILKRYNLQPMGWEEITHFCPPESKAICYSWLNSNTKPLEMAEAGYPVVLANANRLYFDFAYCNHHEEKGLNWGGYTDEYRSFDWEPLIHPNVVGMNAQLWGEVIRSFAQVEWQIYPKIYGLAERAWNNRSALTLGDYNKLVYEVFMPQLYAKNCNFHIQQPGIRVVDGMAVMNKVMKDGVVEYRFDEGDWMTYSEPVLVPADAKIIQAKVTYLGKESNTTWLWLASQTQLDESVVEQNTGATF